MAESVLQRDSRGAAGYETLSESIRERRLGAAEKAAGRGGKREPGGCFFCNVVFVYFVLLFFFAPAAAILSRLPVNQASLDSIRLGQP